MHSRQFTLPKRQTRTIDEQLNWVIIDVTKSPIERPQINKEDFIVGRRKDTS